MVNARRGEIAAELGGQTRTLCLTLGALAELEHAFGASDLMALAERFEQGRLSAKECQLILHAGLKGAGETLTLEEVGNLSTPHGASGYVRIVMALLTATFGSPAHDA
jgi:Phage tail tube protein, GTA-gp10